MANQMVHTVAKTAPKDDQSWLINRITDGVREAQLDLSTFTADKSKENDYFSSISDDDYEAWLKSGIPLAKITDTNNYGPYDKDATDGRNGTIIGFLESSVHVVFTRTGFEDRYPTVGVRYMGVIDKANLPYTVDFSAAQLEGLFLDYDKDAASPNVSVLNPTGGAGTKGDKGDTGASVTAIKLTKDAQGAITGGTATLSDKTTVNITVA